MNDEADSHAGAEDNVVLAEPVEAVAVVDEPGTPWGFWVTLLFSGAVLGLFVTVQTMVVVPFAVAEMMQHPRLSPEELTESLEANGLCLGLATLFSGPACVGLIWVLAKLRRGISVREYLALKPVSMREILFWGLAVGLFLLASDGLTYLLGREVVPEQMTRAYETAGFVPLLWFAIICLGTVVRGDLLPRIRVRRHPPFQAGRTGRDSNHRPGLGRHPLAVRFLPDIADLCRWPAIGHGTAEDGFGLYDDRDARDLEFDRDG